MSKRMMNQPLISVVIPVFNGAHVISGAIDSILAQNMNCEIIVVDDGSTDELSEVLLPYQQMPFFHYMKNDRQSGVAFSRNRGVEAANGEYIAFLDCDDWWEPQKLHQQMVLLQKTGTVLCATGRRLVRPDGSDLGKYIGVKPVITYKDLLTHNMINCSSVLMKTEVAREFPMVHDESHEDYIMWLQILGKYKKVCAIDEPLLNYRLSSTGKSGSKLASAKKTYMVYRYVGFSRVKAGLCFISYALHGIKKYYFN